MPTADEHQRPPAGTVYGSPDPGPGAAGPSGGTVYGATTAGTATRRSSRDRLLTVSYVVGGAGVLLGLVLATGVLVGGGDGGDQAAGLPAPVSVSGDPSAEPGAGADGGTGSVPPPSPTEPPSPTPPAIPAWTFRSVASSFCLALSDGGAEVRQVVCAASPNQQWRPTPVVGDQISLVNVATGQCLEVADANRDDGARLRPAVCDGSLEQQWRTPGSGNGQTPLININSGRCLDVPTQTLDQPDTGLQQWGCHGRSNQQWTGQPG
ncbi:RICIN domain-containing protein [Micromonospora sp. NPDC050397]|uniref:RICIN domain-containing protein n=1 Tax=Micromonospora sp. NPDC050397 TaxID=3364279 RepID=UPI00384F405A